MDNYTYISSDNTEKDVRSLHTEYIINALAKAHREFYNQEISSEVRNKYIRNITVLENELAKRQADYLAEKNKAGGSDNNDN